MSFDLGILENDRYTLTFNRSIFSELVPEQPLLNLMYLRKRIDDKKIAVISIYNYDAKKIDIFYVLRKIAQEFGIFEIVNDPQLVNEKLGDNLWRVYRMTDRKASHIYVWIYGIDDEFMIQVMLIFSDTDDSIYNQIREMIADINIEKL